MNTQSAVFNLNELEFPRLGAALVESAIMGYGVIAYDRGLFHVVWWDGDQQSTRVLNWVRCLFCDSIQHVEGCTNCADEISVEVA